MYFNSISEKIKYFLIFNFSPSQIDRNAQIRKIKLQMVENFNNCFDLIKI